MFELLNTKWGEPSFGTPSGTITWSSDLGGDLALANGVSDNDIDAALNAAFNTWESVAAVEFQEVNSGADVTIGAESLGIEIAGVATFGPVLAGLNEVTAGSIAFNSDFVWAPEGDGGTDFFAVALHEIGHIIGLDHPNDPTQIMNAIIRTDNLGEGDIAGAQLLYGTDPGDVDIIEEDPDETRDPINADGGDGGSSSGGGAIAIVLGLLAAVFGLFTGGAGAVVAMAAGRVLTDDDEDETGELAIETGDPMGAAHVHDGECMTVTLEDGSVGHGVMIEDAVLLPGIDFTQKPNPCGCMGMCEHIMDMDEPVEDFLV